ncbi:MAG: hypothetical protein KAH97_02940 [Anaerolineales bacterium]|nr:hypothetical protein [Anaerolineales bacterium]
MGTSKPPNSSIGRKISVRTRLTLAIVGVVFVLLSTLLLISLSRRQPHEQLRYSPPATLFAPPEAGQ